MDRRSAYIPSLRLRERLKMARRHLEETKTRKVGFVRKFIHIARSGATVFQYYVDELVCEILKMDDALFEKDNESDVMTSLRALRSTNRGYKDVIKRLSDEFESDTAHPTQNSLSDERNERHLGEFDDVPKLNLILAEDNLVIQKILFRVLEKSCKNLVIVDNGLELVRVLQEERYNIRQNPTDYCIISDINMPIVDGKTASAMIQTLPYAEKLPIIALTGTAITENNWLSKYGFDAVIPKPFSMETLYQEICVVWRSKWMNEEDVDRSDSNEEEDCEMERSFTREEIIDISQKFVAERSFHQERTRLNKMKNTLCLLAMAILVLICPNWILGFTFGTIVLGKLNAVVRVLPFCPGFTSNLLGFLFAGAFDLDIDGLQTANCFIVGIYSAFLRISDRFNGWHSDAMAVLCLLTTLFKYNLGLPRFASPMSRYVLACNLLGVVSISSAFESILYHRIDEEERDLITECNRNIVAATKATLKISVGQTHALNSHLRGFERTLRAISNLPLSDPANSAKEVLCQTRLNVSRLCESLAKYCQIQGGRIHLEVRSSVNLREFVDRTVEEVTGQNEGNVEVDIQISKSTIVGVHCNSLSSIVSTLVLNALTHGASEHGVVIQVTAKECCNDPNHLDFEFTVKDFGCGMSEEARTLRLQDPFSHNVEITDPTLNRGISLYLSSVLAQSMNGLIELKEGQSGKGVIATFSCQLELQSTQTEYW